MFDLHWGVILGAYVMDFLFADPRRLPHPVIYMGKAISFFEPNFRKISKNLVASGFLFAVFLIMSTWIISFAMVKLFTVIHPMLGVAVQMILIFYCFSAKSLEKAAMDVFDALAQKNIVNARKKVGMIVGRQTDKLDEAAVTRACVETVAENFVDGFVSPLFFAVIGGAPLALAYKMVNTLDSMVGYKNEIYLYFGRASARIDDAANFIPARISVFLIFLAGLMVSWHRGVQGFLTGFKEGRHHKSPNAGFPEAAFAGVLGVKLGGPSVYHGTPVEKPFLGAAFKNPVGRHIRQACDLMMAGAFLSILISCFILFCFQAMLV